MGCFPSKEGVYHSDAYAALQNQVRQLQQQLNVAYQGSGYAPPVVYQVRSGAGVDVTDHQLPRHIASCMKSQHGLLSYG
jgi:hypothetical protein